VVLRHKLLSYIPAALVIVLFATGLGVFIASRGNDASVSGRVEGSAEKINMPHLFNTISDRCVHGFRVFEASSGGGLAVVRDPRCPAGAGSETP
jgi:hypothetical protein